MGAYSEDEWKEAFWSRVSLQNASGCWLWTAAKNQSGHGMAAVRGRTITAHRAAYQMEFGPVPDGLFVCHHCDVPACVNPYHMFVGTAKDNALDCKRKGRLGKRGRPRKHHGLV